MSSGKSSSMVVVLLLVAVVASTYACGAHASFNITNNCNKAVIIATSSGTANSLIFGGSLHVPGLPNTFFIAPVTFTIRGIPVVTVSIGTATLDRLNQLGDSLHKIESRCVANNDCITLYATYTPLLNPGANTIISLGSFCL